MNDLQVFSIRWKIAGVNRISIVASNNEEEANETLLASLNLPDEAKEKMCEILLTVNLTEIAANAKIPIVLSHPTID